MIKSMTGFGSVRKESEGHELSVDVKSLNSKFMDLSLRLPKEIQDKEPELRKMISDTMQRGKVQLSMELKIQSNSEETEIINHDLFESYYSSLIALADKHNADKAEIFKIALQMPEVINTGIDKVSADIWKWIKSGVEEACKKADEFRRNEGKSLEEQLTSSIGIIKQALQQVEDLDIQRRKNQEKKLKDSISEIEDKVRVDQNRFEQELIYYLEKMDISEEKVRLKSHLDYFDKTLKESNSNGKRLQFISQEIGREINTIGSKANNAELQQVVVMMKDELEKIKEQSLNIL